jgi:DNA-binding response OmpR family regulator
MSRVLVVEDDASVRAWLSVVLARRGYAVQTATTAGEALAFLLYDIPQTPDVALVDVQLPDITGIAFGSILKGYFPAVRMVYMTGYPNIEPYDDSSLGRPLLRKPFTISELLAHIE